MVSYEREIYPYLEPPRGLFVDIGSAEGGFLVGMAVRGREGVGFEIDPLRRRRARELAKLNGVYDRVDVRRKFEPHKIVLGGALVLCDIEGAESTLIPEHAEHFVRSRLIVEFHLGSEHVVVPALEPTHNVTVVPFGGREHFESEIRPDDHLWGVFEPKA